MEQSQLVTEKKLFFLDISRNDRWEIRRRLTELAIQSHCDRKGQLSVSIDKAVDIAQIRSVVRSWVEHRDVLRQGLECCWRLPVESHP